MPDCDSVLVSLHLMLIATPSAYGYTIAVSILQLVLPYFARITAVYHSLDTARYYRYNFKGTVSLQNSYHHAVFLNLRRFLKAVPQSYSYHCTIHCHSSYS
jgi:hypothetical protein